MTKFQIIAAVGIAWVFLMSVGFWVWYTFVGARKVEVCLTKGRYLASGMTADYYNFKVFFDLADEDDPDYPELESNVIAWIKCWMRIRRARIETIVDTKTNKIIYFRDIE